MKEKKLHIEVMGSQATSFVFDSGINVRFNSDNYVVDNHGKFSIKNTNYIKADIIIFDLLFDVVSHISELPIFFQQLDLFLKKLDGHVIYNSVRWPNQTSTNEADFDKNKINDVVDQKQREWRNSQLDAIENYIKTNYPSIKIIPFYYEISAIELNNSKGYADLFFNSTYYFHTWLLFEKISSEFFPYYFPLFLNVTGWHDLELLMDDNKYKNINNIVLLFKSPKKWALLRQAIEEPEHSILRKVFLNDFVIDGGIGNTKVLVKRTSFYRSDLEKNRGIYFQREINSKRLSGNGIQRILFYFEPMNADNWATDDFRYQALPGRFRSLSRSLVKDTALIRIADVNLSRGSYWFNSRNYSHYKDDMMSFIENIISEYNVSRDNVVLYGFSRGGFGSLYYGKLLDLQVVSVDPVIDASFFVESRQDMHFLKYLRKIDLVSELNEISDANQEYYKIILSNEKTGNKIYENSVLPIDKGKTLKVNNLKDKNANWHGKIAEQTVPETLTLINGLLDSRFSINWQ